MHQAIEQSLVQTGLICVLTIQTAFAQPPASAEKAKSKREANLPFTISFATTRITKPLKEDGTPDYAAALNARLSKGVTPKNNAAVPLMKAFGAEIIPKPQRRAFYRSLGIPLPKRQSPTLVLYSDFVEEYLKPKEAAGELRIDREPYWDQQTQAMERPWSRKDLPLVAEWLDANVETLKIAVAASQKPRLYFPIVYPDDESLIAAALPISVTAIRELARLLTARGMLAIHEENVDAAANYLLACHRLASLQGQQPTLIDALVSVAIDHMAFDADRALLGSDRISRKQFANYRQLLQSLPALPKMSEKFDHADRFIALDSICNVALGKLDPTELGIPNEKLRDRLLISSVDWNLVLKRVNSKYDEIAPALTKPTHRSRQRALTNFRDRLVTEIRKKPSRPKRFVWAALKLIGGKPPEKEISRYVGNLFLAVFSPSIESAYQNETRARIRRELMILALALAEYRLENKTYPDSLDALSPKYLKMIPLDVFTNEPLKYEPSEKGFLLYSLGPNGIDDDGEYNIEGADDIAIRVPEKNDP